MSGLSVLTVAVVVLYVLLTLGIVFRSPVLTWDSDLFRLDLRRQHPAWKPFVFYYVMLGQRGPATLAFLPFFFWVAWRDRTSRPLVMLVTSLVLLNISVGIVKLATGRLGPRATPNTHDLFVGGNIYPSGHVSNAVVLYGLIAMLAVNRRTVVAAAAVVVCFTVGLGTIYLDTHWLSDVLGGWIAGALVLLVLPVVMPGVQRRADSLLARLRPRTFAAGGGDGTQHPFAAARVSSIEETAPSAHRAPTRFARATRQRGRDTPVRSDA